MTVLEIVKHLKPNLHVLINGNAYFPAFTLNYFIYCIFKVYDSSVGLNYVGPHNDHL